MASETYEPEAGHSGCPCAKSGAEQAVCPCGRNSEGGAVSERVASGADARTPGAAPGELTVASPPAKSR